MILDKPLSIRDILVSETEKNNFFLFTDLINRLVEDSRDMDGGKGSISLAVNGDWGSGKTSYLKALESYYRDFCGFPVVFFEAWKYQEDENPLVPLIMEIKESTGISPQLKAKFTRILKPIAAAGLTLSDMLLHSLTGKNLEDIEKNLKRVEDEFYKRSSKYRDNLKELEEAIKGVTRKFEPKSINPDFRKVWTEYTSEPNVLKYKLFVLIIDDLDRLISEKAFKIIETLRFYFDIDNVLIIMGINDEILNSYVDERYGMKSNKKTDKKNKGTFLDKIFQWHIELSAAEVNDYHLSGIRESKILIEEDIEIIELLLKKLDPLTHRKWIKVCNRLEKEIRIGKSHYAPDSENTNVLEKIIFSALLKELFPEFEVFSRRLSEEILEDIYSRGTESTDPVVMKALDKIRNDTTCFCFPEQNFNVIRETTLSKVWQKDKI
jgi:hypothetical protein